MPSLTGNTALDVAVGLAFTYLLFSLLCSGIQESIAGMLDLRSRKLEQGLRSMLQDDGPGSDGAPTLKHLDSLPTGSGTEMNLVDEVLGHDLIRSQYRRTRILRKVPILGRFARRERRGPSYISPRTFATALLDVFTPADAESDPLTKINERIAAENLPAGTKRLLLNMAGKLAHDRDHLRGIVEQWFDDTMARVSGWYKRQAQIILCVIAAIVTIGLNVNTVAIAERLINDKSVRAEVAQQAAKTAQPPSGSEKSLEAAAKRVEDVGQLGIPFGWHEGPNDPARVSGHLGRTAIGWLLTFLALSLGAPFWFDALSKLARLRTSGVPEGPHETTPRKDDPPAGGATTTVTTAAGAGTSTETVTRTTSTEPGAG